MEKGKGPSRQVLQRRKFLMVLPLLVIPFLTLFFWALVGGKRKGATAPVTKRTEGFNMDLPNPKVQRDSSWNKMKFYEQADKEAAQRQAQIRNDPYYHLPLTETEDPDTVDVTLPVNTRGKRGMNEPTAPKSPYASTAYKDPNEARVYQKLAELDRELAGSANMPGRPGKNQAASGELRALMERPVADTSPELQQLKQMMEDMEKGQSAGEPDTDMQEINQVLDKLMDVQHPERIAHRLQAQSEKNKRQVFPVAALGKEVRVSLLENQPENTGMSLDSVYPVLTAANGFYSLEDNKSTVPAGPAITAVVHENQILVAGATVKLRLTTDIYIQGVRIPKDQFLYGTAALNGERLTIRITSVRYQEGLYPVELTVYDLDGMAGIHIPGAITRDVAKQSADQSLQDLGLGSLDPTLVMQAASAGIEMTKNLLSKKVRLVKVMVKAGYQVLLKDNNVR